MIFLVYFSKYYALFRGEYSPGLICLKKGKVKISSEISNGNEKIFGFIGCSN